MISDREAVYARLRAFEWAPATSEPDLEAAVLAALAELPPGHLNVAYSGGVDSSVLLCGLLVHLGREVTAHTITAQEGHPDVQYARMATQLLGVEHVVHQFPEDSPGDKYRLLMLAVGGPRPCICGDVIDEVLGGYYEHQRDPTAFRRCLDTLIPKHLDPLDVYSSALGITVHLPYASAPFLQACRQYAVSDLADTTGRKKPLYRLAATWGIPEGIQLRRKRGLVNALEVSP